MDLLKLRQLAAVVRYRSFLKAADALGISQPALSKNIRSLEKAVGVALLERGRFGALPTPYGLALVRHADAIEAEVCAAQNDITALKTARKGHLRVGCGPSEATRLLPTALLRLGLKYPGIKVTVLYGLTEALVAMVKHGEVDFALSSIPNFSTDPDVQHLRVHEDSGAVVVRFGHPLGTRTKPLQVSDLEGQRWILASRRELERRALDDLFTQADKQPPEPEIETTSAVLMKTVVMQSDFVSFLPRELIFWEESCKQIRPLDISATSWRRIVGVTVRARASSSAAVDALIAELRSTARGFGWRQ